MRERLPNRRGGETLNFACRQREYRATLGFYPDGRLGEVFINAGKSGSDVDIATRDSAIALSFALQYGCAPEDIRAALCRDDAGKAEGPLGTLLDLLAQQRGSEAA